MTVDFGILTFVDVERQAVCEVFGLGEEHRVFDKGNRVYWRGRLDGIRGEGSYEIVVAQSVDMGTMDAAMLTNDLMQNWNPQKILVVGIAGSLHQDVGLGDVVVGSRVCAYEEWMTDPDQYPADAMLWNRVQSGATWLEEIPFERPDRLLQRPKQHLGVIVSGQRGVQSKALKVEQKNRLPQMLAVEMEGVAVNSAVWSRAERIGCLVIKGIADQMNGYKQDGWQLYAARVAALFTYHLLKDRPIEPQQESRQGDEAYDWQPGELEHGIQVIYDAEKGLLILE